MKARRKSVEAWASVWPDGVTIVHAAEGCATDVRNSSTGVRTVHLVERDPGAEAELKSLRRLAKASAGLATEWRLMGVASESSMRLLSMAVEAHRRTMEKK